MLFNIINKLLFQNNPGFPKLQSWGMPMLQFMRLGRKPRTNAVFTDFFTTFDGARRKEVLQKVSKRRMNLAIPSWITGLLIIIHAKCT